MLVQSVSSYSWTQSKGSNYFVKSKQLLPFGFAQHSGSISKCVRYCHYKMIYFFNAGIDLIWRLRLLNSVPALEGFNNSQIIVHVYKHLNQLIFMHLARLDCDKSQVVGESIWRNFSSWKSFRQKNISHISTGLELCFVKIPMYHVYIYVCLSNYQSTQAFTSGMTSHDLGPPRPCTQKPGREVRWFVRGVSQVTHIDRV